jgi:hypothetical protein
MERTQSEAFRDGTSSTILKVLDEIDKHQLKQKESGFNEFNYTIGVLNCFLIFFVFGCYPQYFWILYMVQALYLIPAKFGQMWNAKPMNEAFYYLDFCWIMNFIGISVFFMLIITGGTVSDEFRHHMYLATQGVTCGVLLGATCGLDFIALQFHNRKTMTGVFIHVYPPLLFYIHRWKSDIITEFWPNMFHINYDTVQFFPSAVNDYSLIGTVFGNAWLLYMVWWVIYISWQLLHGFHLPKGGRFDTVFHSTMRGGVCIMIGKVFWKRSKEKSLEQMKTHNYELRDLFVYMAMHWTAATGSMIVLAYPCSLGPMIHGCILVMVATIVTWRGAKKYTYYSTKMYSRMIRKQFAADIKAE